MAINFNSYSTTALMGAYQVIDVAPQFLYDVFFKTQIQFDTELVFLDQIDRNKRLAPLVSPNVPARTYKQRSYSTTAIQPAYIKVRHEIVPGELLRRRAGEQFGGVLTPQERLDLAVAQVLQDQVNDINRRKEALAAQCLLTGGLVLQDVDFPTQTVSYNRPSANTITLSGSTAWGATGVDALEDLRTWSTMVQATSGFVPRVVVMDPLAFDKFRTSPGVATVMNSFRQTSGDVNLAGYAVGGVGNEAMLMANVAGFEIWVYQAYIWDANGNQTAIMPDNTVIMGDPVGAGGTRLYGAIQDIEAGMVAQPIYSKSWLINDPSALSITSASAPLPALGWSQATLSATVA
ncbi:major capsid protein [Beijerinckia sp. L45]|uniref:major capsid protein n=1 Tax=Beijerinckia sp. L45 TaxID=1641855 RepID=UPI00131D799A|nr:major capsid protein [Beijerinckia sp. L45]